METMETMDMDRFMDLYAMCVAAVADRGCCADAELMDGELSGLAEIGILCAGCPGATGARGDIN